MNREAFQVLAIVLSLLFLFVAALAYYLPDNAPEYHDSNEQVTVISCMLTFAVITLVLALLV